MFQAGFARLDVTPPLGTELTGYFQKRISDGVLDPIELNALAIHDGQTTALVIASDFMYANEKALNRFRTLISESTGLPMDRIMIQSTHPHTSTTLGPDGPTDANCQWFLERKYCDVARMAIADLKDAAVSIAEQETAVPISFIRRYKMKDGSTLTNPGYHRVPDIECPAGKADNTVRIVKFARENAKDIALVNFQTHPDVVHGNKFSADWPGFVRRFCEQDLKNVNCMLINGFQGDVNHINLYADWDGYGHSEFMGRTIADAVVQMWDNTVPTDPGTITTDVQVRRIPSNLNGLDRIDDCLRYYNAFQAGQPVKPLNMNDLGEVWRIAKMDSLPVVQRVLVSMVAFGRIALIGYGGEPFTEYADRLRAARPDLHLLTACLANGAQGYLPSASAFLEGGYEARSSNFTEPVATELYECSMEMLSAHLQA